jgi:hypothetical protein
MPPTSAQPTGSPALPLWCVILPETGCARGGLSACAFRKRPGTELVERTILLGRHPCQPYASTSASESDLSPEPIGAMAGRFLSFQPPF